jgi:predicted RNA-binding Zn-ribbon protein involved in translation (DUF1610 family)
LATDTPERIYRAPCPGCGAPVEFRSAQSTHAVCGYCQSTVVRSGDKLSRIGKMAELFDDHSPLQLLASGQWSGQGFTLVGRLQYKYRDGTWTEWHALRDDGSSAWLSEDNGAYVFTLPVPAQRELPTAERFRVGGTTAINGKSFSVASNETVALISAQGELPRLPALGQEFSMVELRSAEGEVLSVDYGAVLAGGVPTLSLGKSVLLEELKLTGLRIEVASDEKGQQFACPNCGAAVQITLSSSKSITCGACHSLIDLSQGVGGQLQHALQDEPVVPLIPLGNQGQLQGVSWQVVGFQHRVGTAPGDDESFGWDEYLLFNQKRGFSFLVDSQDGWSLVKPTTGAPSMSGSGAQSASYLGTRYQLKDTYTAQTTYVQGEFYWRVERGQTTQNRDFVNGKSLLSLEQTPNEITWSSGGMMDSATIVKAFGLEDKKDMLQRSDVAPFSASGLSLRNVLIAVVVMLVLVALLSRCSSTPCDPATQNCSSSSSYGSRSSGGSFGGSSSGGGHK